MNTYYITVYNHDTKKVISVWVNAPDMATAINASYAILEKEYQIQTYYDLLSCVLDNN